MDFVQITLDKTARFFSETFPYGPSKRKLGSDFGRFQERKMCFVAICGSGQPFSWTGVGVRWIKAGIFTIDVAQIWQDFQQSPTPDFLAFGTIWARLECNFLCIQIQVVKRLCHALPAETCLRTCYKKKCCQITFHISGIQRDGPPPSDEAKNGRLLLSLLATNTQLPCKQNADLKSDTEGTKGTGQNLMYMDIECIYSWNVEQIRCVLINPRNTMLSTNTCTWLYIYRVHLLIFPSSCLQPIFARIQT